MSIIRSRLEGLRRQHLLGREGDSEATRQFYLKQLGLNEIGKLLCVYLNLEKNLGHLKKQRTYAINTSMTD